VPGRDALFRTAQRESADLTELRRRARPKPRGDGLTLPEAAE
jgi:hypothetical protein